MQIIDLQSGSLEKTPVLLVLATAYLSKVTGTFTFVHGLAEKKVFLRQGQLIGATSNQRTESLGRLLVAWGWISKEAYEISLEAMDKGLRRHGEILVDMGALKSEQVPLALKRQNRARLADIVTWQAGQYVFVPAEELAGDEVSVWETFQDGIFLRYGASGLEANAKEHKEAIVRRVNGNYLESLIFGVPDVLRLMNKVNDTMTVMELARGEKNDRQFLINLLILEELGLVEISASTEEEVLRRELKRALGGSSAQLLGVQAGAPPDTVRAAREKLLARFPASRFGTLRHYTTYVQAVTAAEQKLLGGAKAAPAVESAIRPLAERDFQRGKEFLRNGNLPQAAGCFKQAAASDPASTEYATFGAVINFLVAPDDAALRQTALDMLGKADTLGQLDADTLAYYGAILKLANRLDESQVALQRALALQSDHAFAARELESVSARLKTGAGAWSVINRRTIDFNAQLIIQRRIMGPTVIQCFYKNSISFGCDASDDLIVSAEIVPQVVKSHCSVFEKGGRIYVVRNGHGGVMLLNGDETNVRRECQITAEDFVMLGHPAIGPTVEFRVLDRSFLRNIQKDDQWTG